MSGEQSILLAAALGLAAVIVFVVGRHLRSGSVKAAEAQEQKIRQEVLDQAVERGILDGEGKPLCKICGDKDKPETRATEWDFRIERGEGLWAWFRQQLGAPARLQVGRRRFDGHRLCRGCAAVMGPMYSSFLLGFEQRRRTDVSEGEVECRYWELEGSYNVVKGKIDEHAKGVRNKKKPVLADVTTLRPNGTTSP